MAYAAISKPGLHFNTKLYTGNGSTQSITGVGFQPDWTWIKRRDGGTSHHQLFDAVRGATKRIYSSSNAIEDTATDTLTSFDSDGFSVGANGGVNGSSNTTVAWNWKANGAGSANTDGDINSTVSANTTAGFSIVKYTGNGSNDQRVGHGLGARPVTWFIKRLDTGTDDWVVYHQGLASNWYDDTYLYLNTTNPVMGSINAGTGNPTTSVFYVGSDNRTNASGNNYIAYVFAEKKGFSKFGSYTGNGNADGTFVYTGFKPAFVLQKNFYSGSANDWTLADNKRPGYNETQKRLVPNTNAVEATNNYIDLLSNGFKNRGSQSNSNASSNTYVYWAFAEEPLVANVGQSIPATAK